ncbi:MAG: DUF692 domain-containing protein [Gammaproteobacteria bacterium]|nr:DUF692 domain-containing protein [Gammaproteobacteria bacterium]MCP5137981.1 DUF692 domain-containing protein [Gammaproteobacteria bacterium]
MIPIQATLQGAGLGFRRSMLPELASDWDDRLPEEVGFWEVAPENWIGVGGRLGRQFRAYTERHPFICHGLSLSLGGPAPLDEALLVNIRDFIKTHDIRYYSEHLSYCSDDGHLYDLMPIPFTEEAVHHVAGRIQRSQDILGQRIAIENVSYYAAPGAEMREIDFINAVLAEADCELLLDVNNIYVNSINHRYDAHQFLAALPSERVAYIHVAGHYDEADDLIVDTHGADVIDPVWDLLNAAYRLHGTPHPSGIPTLLERDFNIPPLTELLGEIRTIRDYQHKSQDDHARRIA